MEIAIEVPPSWYWLYDCLEDEGFKVKLSHPLKAKAIDYAKVKTDKVDSALDNVRGEIWIASKRVQQLAEADRDVMLLEGIYRILKDGNPSGNT